MTEPISDEEQDEFWVDHRTETNAQVVGAIDSLLRPDEDWVPWPWPDLTGLVGRMKPRDVWFVCGFSGNGKTLFTSSAIQEWIKLGVRVYVMPLETSADDFRMYLACQNVGIDPGTVNSGRMLDMPDALRGHWEDRIRAEIDRQAMDAEFHKFVKIKGVDAVNLRRLCLAAEEAEHWKAKVLIVDHIDHIQGGDGTNLYAEAGKVLMAAKTLAKKHNLVMLFTSQMNNEMLKGGKDRLSQFAPPMPHHVYMGGDKRKIATGMIGLHRRLRDRGEDETPDEYAAAIKRSRDGDSPPLEALQPGVMALTAMKLRNDGSKEGQRCFLAVEHGRVLHLPEKDTYRTTYEGVKRV